MRLLLWVMLFALGGSTLPSRGPNPSRRHQPRRSLPQGKLVVGYATACLEAPDEYGDGDAHIMSEAYLGVNVVIWSFINLVTDAEGRQSFGFGLNSTCIASTAKALRDEGIEVAHLISVGGWDAPHPNTSFSADEWWGFFQRWNLGSAVSHPGLGFYGFDGIDWDIEGVNDLMSPNNVISHACFTLVGELSLRAKASGYVVTMVPPQSYLDLTNEKADLSLRHVSECMPSFHFAGENAYAALLAKYNASTFDLVSVQLYETWCKINCAVRQNATSKGATTAQILADTIRSYIDGGFVDFAASVPELGLPSQRVSVRPDQLVIGFSFGAGSLHGRSLYINPQDFAKAYAMLPAALRPRGAMFWNLELDAVRPEEGDCTKANCSFAHAFNGILR